MGTEENSRVCHEFVAAHRAHDIPKMVTFLAEDITIRSAAGRDKPPFKGKEEAAAHWRSMYTTFPDFRMDVIEATAVGDSVLAEIEHGGTMMGAMKGASEDWEATHYPFSQLKDKGPTGKSYRVQSVFRMDFSNGKIRSIMSYWDTMSMLSQLGLLPD